MSPSAFSIYGLTGGIASGKSKVAEILRSLGIETVDADEIARGLRAPGGPAESMIRKRFGTLDSAALREIISRDPVAKSELEGILHPMILAESARRFDAIRERHARAETNAVPYAIYEAALLVEAGRAGDFDGVILVESEENLRLARLIARDGMLPPMARQFLGAQPPLELKREAATHHLINNGSLEQLTEKVRRLDEALRRGEKSFRA